VSALGPAAANPSHALALTVVDELARAGVTDAVLAPGSRSTALALALHDDPRLRLHVEIDERSAAFLAVGLGRATGRPAAVVTTSGSAVANLHPGVVEADTGQVPLLVLSADRPPELRHTGANQTIDQLKLFGDAVRWFVEVGVAADVDGEVAYWRSTVSRLVSEAVGLAGPPGPVHANLAFREPTVPSSDDGRTRAQPYGQPLDGRAGGRPWLEVRRGSRRLDDAELAALAGRLATTERGLIVVGQTDAPADAVHALARATGYPVIAEPGAAARMHDEVISTAHHLLSHAAFAAAHVPDLVVRIGRPGLSGAVATLLGPRVPQVLVDPHGSWHDPGRGVGQLLAAEVGPTCLGLADHLAVEADSEWRQRWRAAEAAARRALDRHLDAHHQPTEPRIARDVAAAVPRGGTLVAASSMPIRDLDQFAAPRTGLRVLANRGASGIDGFVSTALGVALAEPGPTVALAGDLSALHDANGLLLSPDAPAVDLTLVVVDNDGGGIFHFLPQRDQPAFERVFGTPHGRDLADLARLHRLGYAEVTRADELPHLLGEAWSAGGVRIVHVRTDRHANLALHRELTAAVGEALDGLGEERPPLR
jgi:2-succinyl-5-enolpyruvyl-6-hydroxy-3-cyclohexene-1-carboxylate synthase